MRDFVRILQDSLDLRGVVFGGPTWNKEGRLYASISRKTSR